MGGIDMTRPQCVLKPFGWRNRNGLEAANVRQKQDKRPPDGIVDAKSTSPNQDLT